MNLRELETLRVRAPHYHATRATRIRTMAQAARWIDRVGFCWLFAPARRTLELPSLLEAVYGKRGVTIGDWSGEAELIWGWKSDLPAARRAYYGKALAGKPVFVSLKMLPYLLAHAGESGVAEQYARGAISYEARRVYEALDRRGAQPTMALRRAAGLDGNASRGSARYHRALDELQQALLVMPMGATNEAGNWPSQIFDLVTRWFPEQAGQAQQIDTFAARRTLVGQYLKTVIAAQPAQIARLFKLPRDQVNAVVAELCTQKFACCRGDWITLNRM